MRSHAVSPLVRSVSQRPMSTSNQHTLDPAVASRTEFHLDISLSWLTTSYIYIYIPFGCSSRPFLSRPACWILHYSPPAALPNSKLFGSDTSFSFLLEIDLCQTPLSAGLDKTYLSHSLTTCLHGTTYATYHPSLSNLSLSNLSWHPLT